ncbi:homoserine dehydrogenase, partial [Pelagibacteraceae bacterium]|nr:homoserine dehydrogenase [Pelagibacteraceae bacterium]
NGTSNFILTSMEEFNISFKEALQKAQSLGFAETNPISDINGDDVSSKLKILTSLAFNSNINSNIYVEGIKHIDETDINNANKLGYRIKLLGVAELLKGKIIQRVHPSLIKKSSYIAGINGVLNAVIIDGEPVGQSIIQGEGAGPKPTTSALVSDISSILRGNIKYPFSISSSERKKKNFDSISNHFFSSYIRIDVSDKKGVLSNITKIFSEHSVSIKRLIQNPYKSKNNSSIIIITHKAKDSDLMKCLKKLSNKNYLIKKPKLIRIED